MATAEKKPGDTMISALKKSISELEEFQVQMALGKAEAHEKFDELKKKFKGFINSTKQKISAGKAKVAALRTDFDELQVQLSLGKADSIEKYNEQKKKILFAISKIEKSMENKTAFLNTDLDEKLRHEIEKFRIKMEVLKVQFELGKLDAKDEFEERKHEFSEGITKLRLKFINRKKEAAKSRQLRHSEMKKAYKNMKKAIVKP
jgi:hypothetical protein